MTKRLNIIYSHLALLGLLLIPVFVLVDYSRNDILICILTGIFSILPVILTKTIYNEKNAATYNLFFILGVLFLTHIEMSDYFPIATSILLLPCIMSLLYCKKETTVSVSLLSYVAAILAEFIANDNTFDYPYFIKISIMLVFFYVLMGFGADFLEKAFAAEREKAEEKEEEPEEKKNEEEDDSYFYNQDFFDTEYLFEEIKRDMDALIGDRKKSFTLELNEGLPILLFANADKIKEAISCICSDLLMYHRQGDVSLYVGYDQSITPRKGQMLKLEMFISSNTDIAALGYNKKVLGAYLTRQIVEKMAGSFEDQSTGEEVAYRLSVMVKSESHLSIGERNRINEQALHTENGISGESNAKFDKEVKVLITDDNNEVCKLLDAVLTEMGAKCTIANSGNEAVRLAGANDYDLLFIDQMMPDKSGEETVREVRTFKGKDLKNVPVILSTVNAGEDARESYIASGFTDCIAKPLRADEIRAKALKYINAAEESA